MPKTYSITNEQVEEIAKARKNMRDASASRRLRAVQLRGEGKSNTEIAELQEFSTDSTM